MTPEQQRVAIAKACGWEQKKTWFSDTDIRLWWHKQGEHIRSEPPDYLNDLNAMHEAELLLDDMYHDFGNGVHGSLGLYDRYVDYLRDLFGRSVRATAAQRAEAFLKTVGKWVEA